MKKVLFVTYGGGHVKMTAPVAKALADSGKARVVVLGLTTAAPQVRAANLDLIQFRDLIEEGDEIALAWGEHLAIGMVKNSSVDHGETVAYLGLCFSELVEDMGLAAAQALFERNGRHAFLPVRTMERMLAQLMPDLVVTTNSPRAERAAVLAARRMGIPAVCMVDLFAKDEVGWIGAKDYADSVCVLNDSVKKFLVAAGRESSQIHVTGNPNFDALCEPSLKTRGEALRRKRAWGKKNVILWPCVDEPAVHPFNGTVGQPEAPTRALSALVDFVMLRADFVLCVRPRPGHPAPCLPADDRVLLTGQDWALPELLGAVDMVVAMNSTIAVEGYFAGVHVIKLLGSVFDEAMPLVEYGLAQEQATIDAIGSAILRIAKLPHRRVLQPEPATERVLRVIEAYL